MRYDARFLGELMKNKSTVSSHVIALALAAGAMLAMTQAGAAEVRPMAKVGADFGGDKLVTVTFTNGDTRTIHANDGFFFGGGVSILADSRDVEAEISLSLKLDTINASNGDVTWSRWPLDALLFYRLPKARFGGGLTYHMNPELKGTGVAGNIFGKFDNALGLLLQADYSISERHHLGLRYTSIEYKLNAPGLQGTAKADGLGLVFTASF
jgi:hypothetical protein